MFTINFIYSIFNVEDTAKLFLVETKRSWSEYDTEKLLTHPLNVKDTSGTAPQSTDKRMFSLVLTFGFCGTEILLQYLTSKTSSLATV